MGQVTPGHAEAHSGLGPECHSHTIRRDLVTSHSLPTCSNCCVYLPTDSPPSPPQTLSEKALRALPPSDRLLLPRASGPTQHPAERARFLA